MNVTIVCEGFDRSSLRLQPWRRVYEIFRRLRANSDSVTILSDKKLGQSDEEEIDGMLIKRISHLMMALILKKRLLKETILKSNPDVVIWYGTPFSAVYLPKLRSLGKPLIWDIDSEIHTLRILSRVSLGEIMHPHHNFLWQQIATALTPRFIIRSVANSALISKVVVPSHYLKTVLSNVGVKPEKIVVIPSTIDRDGSNCLETDEALRKVKRIVGFNSEDFTVAYFGAPCTLRGVDTAILSMPKILTKRKDIKLVIFSRRDMDGSGAVYGILKTEEEYLLKLVGRLRLKEHVKVVVDMLDKNSLKQYLCASDVIVLPFKLLFSEPPLSVFEAMNMGKIVVTTKIGALSEIVGEDRGILIEPKRADELAQAILDIANHPKESAYIRKKARRYASNLPTWEEVTFQFSEMLNETFKAWAEFH